MNRYMSRMRKAMRKAMRKGQAPEVPPIRWNSFNKSLTGCRWV